MAGKIIKFVKKENPNDQEALLRALSKYKRDAKAKQIAEEEAHKKAKENSKRRRILRRRIKSAMDIVGLILMVMVLTATGMLQEDLITIREYAVSGTIMLSAMWATVLVGQNV